MVQAAKDVHFLHHLGHLAHFNRLTRDLALLHSIKPQMHSREMPAPKRMRRNHILSNRLLKYKPKISSLVQEYYSQQAQLTLSRGLCGGVGSNGIAFRVCPSISTWKS